MELILLNLSRNNGATSAIASKIANNCFWKVDCIMLGRILACSVVRFYRLWSVCWRLHVSP